MGKGHGRKLWLAGAILLGGALASLLLGRPVEVAAVMLVAGIAAAMVSAGALNGNHRPAPRPADDVHAALLEDTIGAIAEPLLILEGNRVMHANAAARDLLGNHIVREDVRLAIRHPAAAEPLLGSAGLSAPIHLVGLGGQDQHWEMRIAPIDGARRMVHLADRTGSYATERMRVDFVANASHELRTPLASLLGFIETLRDEAGEEPATRERFLKVMLDEARRMQRLVDDLMSLSRIEAEKYREPSQAVELGPLVVEVCREAAASQGARGGDVVTEIMDAPPVKGDRAQLSQLLHNIVGNAMKYGRPGTPVTIALEHDGGPMVRLSVRDEGEGIAPEHLPRLTERFYRVDSGRSRALGGTGLGLSIVKHIVERHRGRLEIASRQGVGTTVTVMLPVAPAGSGPAVIKP